MCPANVHRALAALCLTMAAGCTSAASDAAPALVLWTISPTPLLRIGTAIAIRGAGDQKTEFSGIVGAVRMPSASVVVADGASRELRVFDRDGHFVRALSRRGGGPGEFKQLTFITRARDTIVALDGFAGILNRYTVDSGFIGSTDYSGGHNSPLDIYGVKGRLTSGALVVTPGVFTIAHAMLNVVTRDTIKLGVLHLSETGGVTWLGNFPGTSMVGYTQPRYGKGVVASARYPYAPQSMSEASGNRVWIGDSGNRDIALYDASGARAGTATWPDSARALDDDVIEQVKRRALATTTNPMVTPMLAALYSASLRPSQAPYFASFHAGPHGEMWVERFRENPAAPAEFVVFDSTGAARATVAAPGRLSVQEVGENYVLGVLRDADGVETVAEYRLQRK